MSDLTYSSWSVAKTSGTPSSGKRPHSVVTVKDKPSQKTGESYVEMTPLKRPRRYVGDSTSSSEDESPFRDDLGEVGLAVGHALSDASKIQCCSFILFGKVECKWLFLSLLLTILSLLGCGLFIYLTVPETFNRVSTVDCKGDATMRIEYLSHLDAPVNISVCKVFSVDKSPHKKSLLDEVYDGLGHMELKGQTVVAVEYVYDVGTTSKSILTMLSMVNASRFAINSFRVHSAMLISTSTGIPVPVTCSEELRVMLRLFSDEAHAVLARKRTPIIASLCGDEKHLKMFDNSEGLQSNAAA